MGVVNFNRVIGLDYGDKTIGVALSDPSKLIASPFETITRTKKNHLRKSLNRLNEIILQYNVNLIVLGLPILLDGSIGDRASITLDFKNKLERKFNIEVVLVNETLTTKEADTILDDGKIKSLDKKKYIDKIAASIILQEYLDNRSKYDKR